MFNILSTLCLIKSFPNATRTTYRGHKAQYEKLYARYQSVKKAGGFGAERKAQKALDTANTYYEANRTEIVLFEAAERYLRDVLQGRFNPQKLPPITKWTEERTKLTTEEKRLNQQYITLKAEVKEMEKIRRGISEIMREEQREQQPQKARDMER